MYECTHIRTYVQSNIQYSYLLLQLQTMHIHTYIRTYVNVCMYVLEPHTHTEKYVFLCLWTSLTICILHRGLYFFFHPARYLITSMIPFWMVCWTVLASSRTLGWSCTSEKKVKNTGSSCSGTCFGGASKQVPFIHRVNTLVLGNRCRTHCTRVCYKQKPH